MAELRFALIGEGNTDEALLPVIQWLLHEHLQSVTVVGLFANRARTTVPRSRTLAERIASVLAGAPWHVVSVHRDADRAGRTARVDEIERAADRAQISVASRRPVVPIVPVRETEAWLLFDEAALRAGAGNPNGTMDLQLPRPARVESLSDPKRNLRDLLYTASGLRGRHRDRLTIDPLQVSNSINDFSPLRDLPAFRAFENDVKQIIDRQGWPERLG